MTSLALGLFLVAIPLVSCGGKSESDDTGDSGDSGSSAPQQHDPMPDDCTVGERRDPEPHETGVGYCVCEDKGEWGTRWVCYGVAPDDPPAGGARGAPPAKCGDVFVQGNDTSNCRVSYGPCSDGHAYSVSCVDGLCYCVMDTRPMVELEPNTGCPEQRAPINEICDWALD